MGVIDVMVLAKMENTLVKEGNWINRVASQFVFQPIIQAGLRN